MRIRFHLWIMYIDSYMNSCIWIHVQTFLGSSGFICFFHELIYEPRFSMNSFMKWRYEFRCKPFLIHPNLGFSWTHATYHGFWPFFMGEIIFKIMSEEYREEYRETYREFMKFKRTIEFIGEVRTRHVWQGQPEPILQWLLQSHLPNYLLFCLAELQCQYLPPRPNHRLSSGCRSCTNLNFGT